MNIEKFKEMLAYKRPAFSVTETEFIEKFILPIHKNIRIDGYGNLIVDTCENPNTIFSCHTDTVDHNDGMRKILHDELLDVIMADDDILGADDCAGVYIMLDMIENNIPGRYIFHRDEEHYCGGSSWILKNTPNILEGIEKAIAFDRMGDSDVISVMLNGPCIEDDFGKVLCEALSDSEHEFSTATGIYTDTMMYKDKIANCTNISVGYYNQHSKDEFIDLVFFNWLFDKVKEIDWQSL